MATPKGAKVSKTKTVELVLSIKGPGGQTIDFDPVDPENEEAVSALADTAIQYGRGGVDFTLVRRETQVRTQVTEEEVAPDELLNPEVNGDAE